MGYVQSGNTVSLTARLTQKGRELMLSGNTQLMVKYFGIGDGDANYRTNQLSSPGHIPDVTGDYSGCTLSLADGVGLKSPMEYSGVTKVISSPTATKTTNHTLKFGFGTPDNMTWSANTFTCDVNLHSLMNTEYSYLEEWYSLTNDNAVLGLQPPHSPQDLPGGLNNPIEFSGRTNGVDEVLKGLPYANFYDFIFVDEENIAANGTSTNKMVFDDIEFGFESALDKSFYELITNIFLKDETYSSNYEYQYTDYIRKAKETTLHPLNISTNKGIDTEETRSSITTDQVDFSPMVLSFSSLADESVPSTATKFISVDRFMGAGSGGLMVNAREFGYYVEGYKVLGTQTNPIPVGGFYPSRFVEDYYGDMMTDSNSFESFVTPAVRVKKYLSKGTPKNYALGFNNHKNDPNQYIEDLFVFDGFSSTSYNVTKDYVTYGSDFLGSTSILDMGKLIIDPFNRSGGNSNSVRGMYNSSTKPSDEQREQMTAFDHIITCGRLLRVNADPYSAYTVSNGAIIDNPSFGVIGNGGVKIGGVNNKNFVGYNDGTYKKWHGFQFEKGVRSAIQFTDYQKTQASLTNIWSQSSDAAGGYGLTLISYERFLLDRFFKSMESLWYNKDGSPKVKSDKFVYNSTTKEYKMKVNLVARSKNVTSGLNQPLTANVSLVFKHKLLSDDSSTKSPIIDRK